VKEYKKILRKAQVTSRFKKELIVRKREVANVKRIDWEFNVTRFGGDHLSVLNASKRFLVGLPKGFKPVLFRVSLWYYDKVPWYKKFFFGKRSEPKLKTMFYASRKEFEQSFKNIIELVESKKKEGETYLSAEMALNHEELEEKGVKEFIRISIFPSIIKESTTRKSCVKFDISVIIQNHGRLKRCVTRKGYDILLVRFSKFLDSFARKQGTIKETNSILIIK